MVQEMWACSNCFMTLGSLKNPHNLKLVSESDKALRGGQMKPAKALTFCELQRVLFLVKRSSGHVCRMSLDRKRACPQAQGSEGKASVAWVHAHPIQLLLSSKYCWPRVICPNNILIFASRRCKWDRRLSFQRRLVNDIYLRDGHNSECNVARY
jgi:hypothetical protein